MFTAISGLLTIPAVVQAQTASQPISARPSSGEAGPVADRTIAQLMPVSRRPVPIAVPTAAMLDPQKLRVTGIRLEMRAADPTLRPPATAKSSDGGRR